MVARSLRVSTRPRRFSTVTCYENCRAVRDCCLGGKSHIRRRHEGVLELPQEVWLILLHGEEIVPALLEDDLAQVAVAERR